MPESHPLQFRPQQLIDGHRAGRCCYVEDYRQPLPFDFCDRRAFVEMIGRHHNRDTFPVCWRHYRWHKRIYPEAKAQTVDWLMRLVNRVAPRDTSTDS